MGGVDRADRSPGSHSLTVRQASVGQNSWFSPPNTLDTEPSVKI